MVWRTNPNPFEVRYAITSMMVASVMLKRRNDKSPRPGRKFLRSKRNASLKKKGGRFLAGISFSGVSFSSRFGGAAVSSGSDATAVAVVIVVAVATDVLVKFSGSCEI